AIAAAALAAACVAPSEQTEAPEAVAVIQATPVAEPSVARPQPPLPLAGPTTFRFQGELTQGGWIRGQVPAETGSARGGDGGPQTLLTATLAEGRRIESPLAVLPRAWNIENINASPTANVPSAEFTARRRPELARIASAREIESDTFGWRQDFVWPVTGRISGRFGSQRVYRGEPGSYHSGIDIATGTSGTPYVAPADGVVVLAAETPFTLEGYLLMIDHGMGLNSAFLHSSELLVREGD